MLPGGGRGLSLFPLTYQGSVPIGPPVNFTPVWIPPPSDSSPGVFWGICWGEPSIPAGPHRQPQPSSEGGRSRVAIALTSVAPDMPGCTLAAPRLLLRLGSAESGGGGRGEGGRVETSRGLPHPLTRGSWDFQAPFAVEGCSSEARSGPFLRINFSFEEVFRFLIKNVTSA